MQRRIDEARNVRSRTGISEMDHLGSANKLQLRFRALRLGHLIDSRKKPSGCNHWASNLSMQVRLNSVRSDGFDVLFGHISGHFG